MCLLPEKSEYDSILFKGGTQNENEERKGRKEN
jgi:hypothetical protein